MPIKISAWKCQYNCGRKVVVNKKSMSIHEKRCYKNPENKTCMTCEHDKFEWEQDYEGHQLGEATYTAPYKDYYCEMQIRPKDKLVIDHCGLWVIKNNLA